MRIRGFMAAVATIALAPAAAADLVEVQLAGAVTSSGALNGKPVEVTFRYATSATPTGSVGGTTNYLAATLVSFLLDEVPWHEAIGGVQKITPGGVLEQYRVEWFSSAFPGEPGALILGFAGPAGTLDDSSLPTVAEFLAFTSRQGSFRADSSSLVQFTFDTASAAVVPVPLPPAVWAGATGLAVLVVARRVVAAGR